MSDERLEALDDGRLMRLSAAGNEEAFRVLYERQYAAVYRVARRIVRDAARAEDVLQETFLALWRTADRFRTDSGLEPWLLRIATNRAIDRIRSEGRQPEPVEEPERVAGTFDPGVWVAPDAGGEDPTRFARVRELEELWDALAARLTPQQRAAFVLYVIEERSSAEVAEILECSASAVRSHVSAARERLRAGLSAR